MSTTIKALSLWEPWATLMALGAKTIETRSWCTSYRGPLLICASKRLVVREMLSVLRLPEFKAALVKPGETLSDVPPRLHFGRAVAVVDLVCCVPTEQATEHDNETAFGDYSPGRFAWVTKNLRRIRPFPVTGHQGLWDQAVDEERLRTTAEART